MTKSSMLARSNAIVAADAIVEPRLRQRAPKADGAGRAPARVAARSASLELSRQTGDWTSRPPPAASSAAARFCSAIASGVQ